MNIKGGVGASKPVAGAGLLACLAGGMEEAGGNLAHAGRPETVVVGRQVGILVEKAAGVWWL